MILVKKRSFCVEFRESVLCPIELPSTLFVAMKAKYRRMRIDELQRLEKELREEFERTKQRGIMQELREVEQVIRDKIWNTGGMQRKKEHVDNFSGGKK